MNKEIIQKCYNDFEEWLKYVRPEIKLTKEQKDFIEFIEYCKENNLNPLLLRSRSGNYYYLSKLIKQYHESKL